MAAGRKSTSPGPRWFELERHAEGTLLRLEGGWRLGRATSIWARLRGVTLAKPLTVDGAGLTEFDAASALVLLRALEENAIDAADVRWQGLAPAHQRTLDGVVRLAGGISTAGSPGLVPPKPNALARFGRAAIELGRLLHGHLNFLGAALAAVAEVALRPRRLRLRELTSQFEQVCISAVPVVALVTMLIGVTIAYLLGLQAEKYGANIFVVDGVGIGMTREFAPIIVATIVAGRSGAAFTAQLGSMRLTEEIDAIRTLGLSPMQVLVVPRVLALMLALPLLVFVGDALGILGALLVADPMLGITPAAFLDRLREALDLKHFWVGLLKAPVFALFIAVIGCRMGMTVGRDTRAVGLATTSTVVQSIVSVILLDAAFAVLMQELGI